MPPERTLIPEIGTCAELTDESLKRGENFPAGARLIDGAGFEDSGTGEALKDRLLMSEEGLFIVSVVLSDGVMVGEPQIESRGVVFADEKNAMRELAGVVGKAVDSSAPHAADVAANIRKAMKTYIFKKSKQSPMIVPVVREV